MPEIDPPAVRRAANAIESVARSVRTEVPDEVGRIASVLAGSASAAAGTSLAAAWADAFGRWSESADTHARSMRASTDAWVQADQAVVDKLSGRRAITVPQAF